jgi:hypothetical protein
MKQTSSSTMEITMKEIKEHYSKVTSKGRRKSPKCTSSRTRSAKERQDVLTKIKIFQKKLQKNKKTKKEEKKESSSILNFTNSLSKSIQILDLKSSKQAKKDKKERFSSESITNSYIHHKEKKEEETKNVHHSNDTISSQDDSVIQTLNQSKHQDVSSHDDDCPATPDNLPTNCTVTETFDHIMSSFDFLFSSVQSIHTDVSAASTDSIMSTADINEPHAEATNDNADDKSKKKCCSSICWSIISAIGGFIILVAIYFGGLKLLRYKCRNEIDLYVENLSIEKNYLSVRKYFESFNQQISDAKCTWLGEDEVKTVFEKKIEEKFKYKIDKVFESFVKTMTSDPASFSNTEFLKLQKFYEEEIKYDLLTKYYQDKKLELETKQNLDLIPAVVIVNIDEKSGYKCLNKRYELDGFDGTIPRYRTYSEYPYSFAKENNYWSIRYLDAPITASLLNWEKSAGVAHPGKLGTYKPVLYWDKNLTSNHIQIKTELFPSSKKKLNT